MRDKSSRAVYEEKFLAQERDRFKAGATPARIGTHLENPVAEIPTLTEVVKPSDILERDILKEVLAACLYHPRVAWCERINSGVMKAGQRYVRFGFKGCSDIIGQLRDGRFFACETKRVGKQPTQEQIEFLGRVHRNHGLAFVARSAADARNALNEHGEAA